MKVDGAFPEHLPRPPYLHHVPGERTQPINPEQGISQARDFFRGFGLPMTQNGLVDTHRLQPDHIDRLQKWRKVVNGEGGVEMPTEDEFYKKVLLAVSLWPQQESGRINYLLGKGAGVEIALRGNARGRIKRPVIFPYRQHSDFELYDVHYNAGPNGANLDRVRVYSDEFVAVFGGQEYFPPTKTKGLEGLPPDLLDTTYETVDLGGLSMFTPELELLFLDKVIAAEHTPRMVDGIILTDAELLARQYQLDSEKIAAYLEEYVIKPRAAASFEYHADRAKPLVERAAGLTDLPYNYYGWLNTTASKLLEDLSTGNATEGQFRELVGQVDTFFAGSLSQKPAGLDTDESHLVDRWINDAEVKRIGEALIDEVIAPLDKIYKLRNKVKEALPQE